MNHAVRIAIVGAVVGLGLPLPIAAQDNAYPAAVYSGGCDERGELLADLTPAAVPAGEAVGRADAVTAAQSRSSLTVPLADLAGSDWSLFVADPGDPETDLACGSIGGVLDGSGSLVIGLFPVDDSDVSGVAYFSPSTAGTDVSLFVAARGSADTGADTTPAASEDGAAGGTADEEPDIDEIMATAEAAPTPTPVAGTSTSAAVPIGTPLVHDGLQVTIDSAYYDYGFANAIPRGGYKILIMGVTLQNVQTEGNKRYSASNFSAEDVNTGVQYGAVTLDNVGVLLTDGDLQPGQYVSGTVLIEVQETATSVYVKYDPAMFDTNDLFWII